MPLELDELREGGPAAGGPAGELAVVRMRQLLLVLLENTREGDGRVVSTQDDEVKDTSVLMGTRYSTLSVWSIWLVEMLVTIKNR